jgi:DDE family transposase
MQDKHTTKTTFFQLFQPILTQNLWQNISSTFSGIDKYIKKLQTYQLFLLLSYAEIFQYRSLDEISKSLENLELKKAVKLDSISKSTISRRLRELPLEVTQILFMAAISQLAQKRSYNRLNQNIGRLYLIDSTTISLCLTRYLWADFRKTKSGVKLHLRLKFDGEISPDKGIITVARTADKKQMDELVVEEKDALNVFDRAYIDYKKFDEYCEKGIRFASRLKGNALVEIKEEKPQEEGSKIKKDQRVRLGKEGGNKMSCDLRLVVTEDLEGNEIVIVTNDFELSAEEISDIYRNRWKIELFFKWIKQHLQIKHLYSEGKQGVENQIYIALISYCLLANLKEYTSYKGTLLDIKRLIKNFLFEEFALFLKNIRGNPKKKSRGRQGIDQEKDYQEIMNGLRSKETEDLYYSCEIW